MGVGNRRKRLRVSQELSEDEAPEEVGEFENENSSDSDFEYRDVKSLSQEPAQAKLSIRVGVTSKRNEDESWVDRYADVSKQIGSATSAKKKNEVASWLKASLGGDVSRMLILAGPPGCGKSSSVRMAARELRCEVVEWQAPATGTRGISQYLLDDFRAFLVGGRYPTLHCDVGSGEGTRIEQTSKVILVEDLPVSTTDVMQNRNMLQHTFSEVAKFSPHPVVVVLSDSEKEVARMAKLVLGSELLQSFAVAMIKIPAVTDAAMKRRLREVLTNEGHSISDNQLADVIFAGKGDIRSALNILQFCTTSEIECLSTAVSDNPRRNRTKRAKRRRSVPMLNVPSAGAVGQDPTLGMYHAVSKVLNNKRNLDGSSKYIAEDILEDARADPASFLAFLHHNYPDFFGDIDDAVAALDCLSTADSLLPWKQDNLVRTGLGDCAASLVTRGFLLYNCSPIQKGWRPIRGPDSYTVGRQSKEHVIEAHQRFSKRLSPCIFTRSTMSETIPFAEIVSKSTISQWGARRCHDNDMCIPVADDAATAMANVEAAEEQDDLAKKQEPKFDEVREVLEPQEMIEDIEDWDDDE